MTYIKAFYHGNPWAFWTGVAFFCFFALAAWRTRGVIFDADADRFMDSIEKADDLHRLREIAELEKMHR